MGVMTASKLEGAADQDPGFEPAPDTHWEGRLTGESGTMEDDPGFRLIVTLRFDAADVDGEGRLYGVEPHEAVEARLFIEGEAEGAALEFDLRIANLAVRNTPFRVIAAIDPHRRRIDGKAFIECYEPETCGCEGGAASIWLRRVD